MIAIVTFIDCCFGRHCATICFDKTQTTFVRAQTVNFLLGNLEAEQVALDWIKQSMGGIEFWLNRDTNFVFLAVDTVPDYHGTVALPAASQRPYGNKKPSTTKAMTASAKCLISSASRLRDKFS